MHIENANFLGNFQRFCYENRVVLFSHLLYPSIISSYIKVTKGSNYWFPEIKQIIGFVEYSIHQIKGESNAYDSDYEEDII